MRSQVNMWDSELGSLIGAFDSLDVFKDGQFELKNGYADTKYLSDNSVSLKPIKFDVTEGDTVLRECVLSSVQIAMVANTNKEVVRLSKLIGIARSMDLC